MSIIRRARTSSPFTTILNSVVEDETLSAEALGLLVYLVGKPDNWQVMPTQLKTRFNCGRDRIYRIMKELITAGYMQREQGRADDGEFGNGNYLVSDEKMRLTENTEAGVSDLPRPENKTLQKKQSKKETLDSRPAKKHDAPYDEDFEALWQQYPRTRNTSKKDAWNFYRVMADDKQEMVRRAVPLFAAAMRAEGRTEDKIMHMIRFLRGGVYETVVAPAAAAGSAAAKPFWETATRQQWCDALVVWSYNWNWKKMWGPEPENPLRPNPAGAPKHHVPQDILDRFDLKYRGHLYSPEQLATIRARVEGEASKHAVDKERAA